MLWNILPTEQRIVRIYNSNPNCKFCLEKNNRNEEGDLEHFLIRCPENLGVSEKLIRNLEEVSNNRRSKVTRSNK